jgi:UDP-glucose 4-epimerase
MMELVNKSVLVTGGAGFIGSHLVDQLLLLGSKVTVLDNFDDFYVGKEENLSPHFNSPRFRLVNASVTDFEKVQDVMKNVDVVFHEAGQAGVRYCIKNPRKAHDVNVTGTINVLLAAKQEGVEKVIYASSSSVYGTPVRFPLEESLPTNPTNPYAATKLAAEKYCMAFWQSYRLPVTCLRYFSVYGPRGRPDQVIFSFADKALSKARPIIYGDGSQTRDFTYISDVVSATLLASLREESNGQVINIGFGKEIRIDRVAKMVLDYYGSSKEPEFVEGYDGDFPRTLCNNSKARTFLGWQPKVPFEEGLKETLKWYDERRNRAYQFLNGGR